MNWLKRLLNKEKAAVPGLVGVEITPQGITIAHVTVPQGGRPRIECCDFIDEENPALQIQKLQQYVHAHELIGARTVVVLHPTEYEMHLIEVPPVPLEEMRAAVRWKVKELTNMSFDEILVDVFMLPEDAYPGQPQMANAVVTNQAMVRQAAHIIKSAELTLIAIDITDLALRNISLWCDENKNGMAFLCVDAANTLISVIHKTNLYFTRDIELGLNDVVDASQQVNADPLDELVLEIQRSLDYYENQLGKEGVSSLLIAPIKNQDVDLVNHIKSNLSVNAMSLDMNELFQCQVPMSEQLQSQSLASIGAALRVEIAEVAT